LAEKVVGVALEPEALPEPDEKRLEILEAHLLVKLLAVELLREAPAGIHAAERLEADFGRLVVVAALVGRVGEKRRLDAFEKDEAVRAHFGRTAHRRDALDEVGMGEAPLVGLEGAHRAANGELDFLHTE